MKLKTLHLIITFCTANYCTTASNKIQSKANQIHAQIQALLEDFAPILPQQAVNTSFDINSIELQKNKLLSLEEIQQFIQTLQLTTQHLQQLNQQYQHQEAILVQHKKTVEQLIKIAQWLYQEKSMETWDFYATIHPQICTTIQKNLQTLVPYAEFDEICLQVGQSIINTISILVLQLHHQKKHPQQLKFFAQTYFDFMNLFEKYTIKIHPEVNSIIASLQAQGTSV